MKLNHLLLLVLLCSCKSVEPTTEPLPTLALDIITTLPTTSQSDSNINRCVMEIYCSNSGVLVERAYSEVKQGNSHFGVNLTENKSYNLLFWADYSSSDIPLDKHYSTQTLKSINIDYKNLSGNDPTRDAYYSHYNSTFSTNQSLDIELVRPFAQLNIYTHLIDVIDKFCPKYIVIHYTKSIADTFNVQSGKTTGSQRVSWSELTEIVEPKRSLKDSLWVHLATDFLLVAQDYGTTLIDFVIDFYSADSTLINSNDSFINIPIQANHTTNIVGELLTEQCEVTINIEPSFENDTILSSVRAFLGVAP